MPNPAGTGVSTQFGANQLAGYDSEHHNFGDTRAQIMFVIETGSCGEESD